MVLFVIGFILWIAISVYIAVGIAKQGWSFFYDFDEDDEDEHY